jgi:hypothetical protein
MAHLGPDALKVMGEAFDAAWAEIYVRVVGTSPVAIEAARLKLADAVLSVASEDSRDVEALKKAALQKMGFSNGPGDVKSPGAASSRFSKCRRSSVVSSAKEIWSIGQSMCCPPCDLAAGLTCFSPWSAQWLPA